MNGENVFKLIGIKDVVKLTGLKETTVRRLFNRNEIPNFKAGKMLYTQKQDVANYINSKLGVSKC